jgi:hypothetical protein
MLDFVITKEYTKSVRSFNPHTMTTPIELSKVTLCKECGRAYSIDDGYHSEFCTEECMEAYYIDTRADRECLEEMEYQLTN